MKVSYKKPAGVQYGLTSQDVMIMGSGSKAVAWWAAGDMTVTLTRFDVEAIRQAFAEADAEEDENNLARLVQLSEIKELNEEGNQ